MARIREEGEKRLAEAVERHAEVQAWLLTEGSALETRVDDLQDALKLGGAGDSHCISRQPRVVPWGSGVLCAGCLTQILHRDVMPLAPSKALRAAATVRSSPQRSVAPPRGELLAEEQAAFFAEALQGVMDPAEVGHGWLWQRRKDPFGLAFPRALASPDRSPCAEVSAEPAAEPAMGCVESMEPNVAGSTEPVVAELGAPTVLAAARRGAGRRGMAASLREKVQGFRKGWR